MDYDEICKNLCHYDERSPSSTNVKKKDLKKYNCYCDNCYNGRAALAIEILRLNEINDIYNDRLCNEGIYLNLNN